MSTMTKVINSFGILRETQAYDAGATVHTRNLVWDSETGDVLVTETVNEYGDKYYAMNFPAHWFYSGMGLACHNSGLVMPLEAGGSSGYYTIGTGLADDYFEAGDQLLAFHTGTSTYYDLWVKSFNVSPDTDELKLIDEDGDDVTLSATSLNPLLVKVIRSGHRNQQKSSMASVTLQENPVDLLSSGQITTAFMEGTAWDDLKLINAGAVEFSDHWIPQCECGFDPVNDDYNEYRYNAAGVWRALKSWLYLADRYHTSSNPHPRNNGFYKDFSAFYYYDYGGDNQWEKDETDWTYASEVTKFSQYGFELENKDALDRYSAAQYGYNVTFPMAVGANGRYQEIGFDGFEDYFFDGCTDDEHFGFRDDITIGTKSSPVDISVEESHTGKHSLIIGAGGNVKRLFRMDCGE